MARLLTTTIGSFQRFSPDLHESIDRALEFQLRHGLDILTDGEQRSDMVSYFAESLDGLAVEDGAPLVTGKISLKGDPAAFSKVEDLNYIRLKYPQKKVKVAITGPTTLGMTCASRKVKGHYRNLMDFDLYEDIALALAPIAKALTDRGAYLQIDEPFLSQGYRDLKERVSLLDYVASGLPRDRVSVHVCGFIGRYGVIDHLLKLQNVSVLSFAFAGRTERPNVDHLSRKAFVDADKKLGVGATAVTPMTAEEVHSPADVTRRIHEVSVKVGRENLAYVHPDCGMRATNKDLVPIILRNMQAGVDSVG
jgi:5-methyltetrahydropteroyltriglutamate--homocysteine methyltransferase